jgi:hypothetical protein
MQKDSNDRHHGPLDITNLQQDEITGEYVVKKVGIYNRLADTVVQEIGFGMIFHDGTGNPPSPLISESYECPFFEEERESFSPGMFIAFVCSLVLLMTTAAVSWQMSKKWWKAPIKQLAGKHMISFNDFLVIGMMIVDFLQYLAMGPEFGSLSYVAIELSKVIYVDLRIFFMFEEETFWMVLEGVYGLSAIFFVCCV